MKTRITARAAVYDARRGVILLVRNRKDAYWYLPGGGWEAERENIKECAAREVKEETGLEVGIGKFLYLYEFHESPDSIVLESYWLAAAADAAEINRDHVDEFGSVGETRWFTREEMAEVDVYPETFRRDFWDMVADAAQDPDRFIGVQEKVS